VKILIAIASFAQNLSGIQRHAFNIARCLLLQPEVSALHLVIAPWQLNLVSQASLPNDVRLFIHIGNMAPNPLSRNLWYLRELPKIVARLGVDVVHFSYPMPLNAGAFHCPTVVSLHDLYPYEIPLNFGFPKYVFNRAVLQQCVRHADSIACVSDATHSGLRHYVPDRVWRKSIRIYNCVEPSASTSTESPIPGWSEEPFLLCVAQHRRNKNIPLLVQAFNSLLHSQQIEASTKLVVIGIPGPETSAIQRLISTSGLTGKVHLLCGLSDANLQWCYSNCAALVAPSIIEGFGLPVAEALLSGCRIVCSDIPVHREIGNHTCHFVELKDEAHVALADAIAASLLQPKPGPVSLPQLSAHVLSKQYLALYGRLIVSASQANGRPSFGSFNSAESNNAIDSPGRFFATQYTEK
jgi:glycosyltransferase involved in cell wall biosynthesis